MQQRVDTPTLRYEDHNDPDPLREERQLTPAACKHDLRSQQGATQWTAAIHELILAGRSRHSR